MTSKHFEGIAAQPSNAQSIITELGNEKAEGFECAAATGTAISWIIEVPFMAATTLDSVVGDPGGRAIQTSRQQIREALGLPKAVRHSIGRKGTVSLDPTAVLLAFAARTRWNNQDVVAQYRELFDRSELAEVIRSADYARCISGTVTQVREAFNTSPNADLSPGLVNAIALDLLSVDETARDVAEYFSLALSKFASAHIEVDRLPGHIVRIDGPEAIIVIEQPERDELHRVDAQYLHQSGLGTAGAAFVLHRQKWTPDTTVGTYIPALRCVNNSGPDEAALRAAEKPLPAL